jgi:limonene-1,2-epoxide hydrolase
MRQAQIRLEQEVKRVGAEYAHVLSESIDTRRDDGAGQAWLHGTFSYVLLGRDTSAHDIM